MIELIVDLEVAPSLFITTNIDMEGLQVLTDQFKVEREEMY